MTYTRSPLRGAITCALVLDDGEPAHPIIDGRLANEDEWTDEDDEEDLPPVRKTRSDPRARYSTGVTCTGHLRRKPWLCDCYSDE